MKKILSTIALVSMLGTTYAYGESNDCINEAAECFQINPLLIKAIIWHESKNQQQALNVNKNKTVDVGIMQINTVHFSALRAKGIDETLLRQNSCVNVFSGAWILKKNIERYGYTWEGIGSYHSRTPVYKNRYLNSIISVIAHKTAIINGIKVQMRDGIREHFSCS